VQKYSYYPFSSEYQLYSSSYRNTLSVTVHDIINSFCGRLQRYEYPVLPDVMKRLPASALWVEKGKPVRLGRGETV
jgi:hypothetical protein